MPKTTQSPAVLDLDDLYAAPTPITATLETANGSRDVVMQVCKDRISVAFMEKMFLLSEKAKETAGDDEKDSPEATKALFDSLTPWISELVNSWNLSAPPTEDTAKRLGIPVLMRLVSAIQGTTQTVGEDAEDPNG